MSDGAEIMGQRALSPFIARLRQVVAHLLAKPAAVVVEDKAAPEPPVLAFIEKTLTDSYRKEIDQEENVWRTLPFFAAILALQVGGLTQIVQQFQQLSTVFLWVDSVALSGTGILDVAALLLMCLSIWPRRFRYVAPEPEILQYARGLIEDEEAGRANEAEKKPASALVTLKWELARQYADGAAHNRLINKARELWRARAGLSILFAVMLTVFLAGTVYYHYVSRLFEKDIGHAVVHKTIPAAGPVGASAHPRGNSGHTNGAATPAHARGP